MLGQEDLRRRLGVLRSEHRDLDDVIAQLQMTAPFNQLQVQRFDDLPEALHCEARKLVAGATGSIYEFELTCAGRRLASGRVSVITLAQAPVK